jgi:hypothetical protein
MTVTEYAFVLPRGYVDEQGAVHREGAMRLATVMDEITPLRDPRVRGNEAYLVVILLSQVITRLGSVPTPITPAVVERLFALDLTYLMDFYRQINQVDIRLYSVVCPHCQRPFEVELPAGSE